MKFLKKNKHLLIVLALFIALAAIAAGCTGKASGAENKGNDDYVVTISGADETPHGTDFGSTDSPSSTPIPTDTPEPTATPAPTAAPTPSCPPWRSGIPASLSGATMRGAPAGRTSCWLCWSGECGRDERHGAGRLPRLVLCVIIA